MLSVAATERPEVAFPGTCRSSWKLLFVHISGERGIALDAVKLSHFRSGGSLAYALRIDCFGGGAAISGDAGSPWRGHGSHRIVGLRATW